VVKTFVLGIHIVHGLPELKGDFSSSLSILSFHHCEIILYAALVIDDGN
jgi:hypothetical protein